MATAVAVDHRGDVVGMGPLHLEGDDAALALGGAEIIRSEFIAPRRSWA